MAKDVTLADIAADVGVSVVAVSKALSGKPGVSDEMRNRIKMVAERLGYIYMEKVPVQKREILGLLYQNIIMDTPFPSIANYMNV